MSELHPKILVVDDDAIVAKSIAEYLCEEGFHADAATSAAQASAVW